MKERVVELLDRIFAVIGAFLFAQIPQFYQQYTTLLSGHLSELAFQIAQMENSAKLTDKTLNQLIQKFLASSDPDFRNQGNLMQLIVDRWTEFTKALQALNDANLLSRPFIFMRYFDWKLFKETFYQFTVGFSFTLESLIYAIVGIFLGYVIFQLFAMSFSEKASQEHDSD